MSKTLEERARDCGIIIKQALDRAAIQFPEKKPEDVVLTLIQQQESLMSKGRAALPENTTVGEHMLSGGPSI